MGWKRGIIIIPVLNGNLSQHRASEDAHRMVQESLARNFGGYSQTFIGGGYIMDDGTLVRDSSVRYETVTGEDQMNVHFTLHGLATSAAQRLDQESILFMVELLPQGTEVVFVRQDTVLNID